MICPEIKMLYRTSILGMKITSYAESDEYHVMGPGLWLTLHHNSPKIIEPRITHPFFVKLNYPVEFITIDINMEDI